MSDTFDSMPSNYFFGEVRKRFGFLTVTYGFSIFSEIVTEDFKIPEITYSLKDFYITIGRGRGSAVVFTGIRGIENLGFSFGQICYFLDKGKLPSERVSGYGPEASWGLELEYRINGQLDWYSDYVKRNIERVLDLFINEENEKDKKLLIDLNREKLDRKYIFVKRSDDWLDYL